MKTKYLTLLGLISGFAIAGLGNFAGAAEETKVSETRTTIETKSFGSPERANKLIGKSVYSSDNQKVGRIENLIVDLESGRMLYAVIGSGPLGI